MDRAVGYGPTDLSSILNECSIMREVGQWLVRMIVAHDTPVRFRSSRPIYLFQIVK